MYAVKTTLIVALMLLLSACQSEIDKCAYAVMKEYKIEEGEARMRCLQVSSGKRN
jgi:hypothetical protein